MVKEKAQRLIKELKSLEAGGYMATKKEDKVVENELNYRYMASIIMKF